MTMSLWTWHQYLISYVECKMYSKNHKQLETQNQSLSGAVSRVTGRATAPFFCLWQAEVFPKFFSASNLG